MTSETSLSDLTSSRESLVSRAETLRDLLRDQAEEAEGLGRYTPAVDEAFQEAGFYRLLTPSTFGGLEVDLRTFAELMIAVGRGDPGTAWCLCLGQGHALSVAAHWPEEAQREVFNNERGYFRASHAFTPAGSVERVDGGLLVNAKSRYQSGVAYATHATVSVFPKTDGPPPGDDDGMPPMPLQVLVPEGQFAIVDDWGGDLVLGMRASGSNSVVVEDQVVPEYYGIEMSPAARESGSSPGLRLHGNPMYLGGTTGGFFVLELTVSIVGAAFAALDECDGLARTKVSPVPGGGLRFKDPMYQRDYGDAMMKARSAEGIVRYAADTMTGLNRSAVESGDAIEPEDDLGIVCMLVQAGRLATEAVELLFTSAGTSASMKGQRMQRYMRDVTMYRTHIGAQYNMFAQRYGATHFGEKVIALA